MGRLAEAATVAARELKPGPKCSTGKLRLRLATNDVGELDTLLDNVAGYTAETIRAALIREADGLGIAPDDVPAAQAIQRHRMKRCRCGTQ